MSGYVAALPMYDWPERRADVDAEWATIRDRLRAAGIDAPERLARRNADLPPVPGGIRDRDGNPIAPDPGALPPDEFDLPTLWRHPRLLFSQTCWGPLETTGLAGLVRIVGQPDYSGVEGGEGELYSSAIVMRSSDPTSGMPEGGGRSSSDGRAMLPLDLLRGARLAFNDPHSMSGLLGLSRDLEAVGENLAIFSARVETGGHRYSIRALADGRADVATIDCRSWQLALLHEPAARTLRVVGWTARRKGLPFITSTTTTDVVMAAFVQVGDSPPHLFA